jgi:hypothetical protein
VPSYIASRRRLHLRYVLAAAIVALVPTLGKPPPVSANVEGDTCRALFDARRGPGVQLPGADLFVGHAPLAHEVDAPIGTPLHLDQVTIDYLRCVATYDPPATLGIKGGKDSPDWIVMLLDRPVARDADVAELRFGASTDAGKWLVLHRRDEGEIASVWRDGQTSPTVYGEIRRPGSGSLPPFTGWPLAGRPAVDTVGFVKPGLFGVATHVASFTYTTFWELASGMRLSFRWDCDSWAPCPPETPNVIPQGPDDPAEEEAPDDDVCLKKPYLPGCGDE